MPQALSIASATAATILIFLVPTPLSAQTTVLNGQCRYSDRVIHHREGTDLIQCDTVSIDHESTAAILDFGQRNWGSTVRFAGGMTGETMAVTSIAFRAGGFMPATGKCEIFRRNGTLSEISCLARAGTRWIAANFVPSRL